MDHMKTTEQNCNRTSEQTSKLKVESEGSPIQINDVRSAYCRYAPIYDAVFGWVLEPGRRQIAKQVRILKAKNILEIGVGTGLTLALYPKESHLTGIDVSAEMLKTAFKRANALVDRHIILQVANAESMAFKDQSFDCVTIPYVLSVTPNPSQLIREARRVCKRGGHIIIANHFSGTTGWKIFERAVERFSKIIGFRSKFDFASQIESHSWNIKSVQKTNIFSLSKVILIEN